MIFEIVHEFDIPRDAVELAVVSPRLLEKLAPRLAHIESVTADVHELKDGALERIWRYQASVKVPSFAAKYVTREMLGWQERSSYDLKRHAARWSIVPNVKPEWQKYVQAAGSYALDDLGQGRTRRVVRGELELHVPLVMKHLGERMIVSEVRKTFDAEAETLRELAQLT